MLGGADLKTCYQSRKFDSPTCSSLDDQFDFPDSVGGYDVEVFVDAKLILNVY